MVWRVKRSNKGFGIRWRAAATVRLVIAVVLAIAAVTVTVASGEPANERASAFCDDGVCGPNHNQVLL